MHQGPRFGPPAGCLQAHIPQPSHLAPTRHVPPAGRPGARRDAVQLPQEVRGPQVRGRLRRLGLRAGRAARRGPAGKNKKKARASGRRARTRQGQTRHHAQVAFLNVLIVMQDWDFPDFSEGEIKISALDIKALKFEHCFGHTLLIIKHDVSFVFRNIRCEFH